MGEVINNVLGSTKDTKEETVTMPKNVAEQLQSQVKGAYALMEQFEQLKKSNVALEMQDYHQFINELITLYKIEGPLQTEAIEMLKLLLFKRLKESIKENDTQE